MRHGIGHQSRRGVPPGGGVVQPADPVCVQGSQSGTQRLGEQVMVAVPTPFVVEPDQEQVVPLQDVEHPPTVGSFGQGVAQVGGQLVEHRGGEEELAHRGRLPVQDLLDQVVEDEAVTAGEGVDESGDLRRGRLGRDGQRGQLKPGGPALGPLTESRDLSGPQAQGHDLGEEGTGLRRSESQLAGSHLDQFRAGPQPGQRQRRVGPGGDGESDSGRQVVEQKGHRVVDCYLVDEVVVVQRQHGPAGEQVQVVDQADQHVLRRRAATVRQQRPRLVAHPRRGHPDRGDQVREELVDVGVAAVQRQPADRRIRDRGRRQPLGHQRRLAEPRRRGDQHEPRRRFRTREQPADEPVPRQQPPTRRGHPQLGGQDRHAASVGGRPAGPPRNRSPPTPCTDQCC